MSDIDLRIEIANAKLDEAIADVHPITLFLFCLINPKFVKYLPRQQPNPQTLYSSP